MKSRQIKKWIKKNDKLLARIFGEALAGVMFQYYADELKRLCEGTSDIKNPKGILNQDA